MVRRLIYNNIKYFTIKNGVLSTPNGVNFSIFYQLLCQDLKLYSTRALQNRKLDRITKSKERNKLMAVHSCLDMAEALFEKHKELKPKNVYRLDNNFCIYEKHLDLFIDTVLMDSLHIIAAMGHYKWKNIPNKSGMWRECGKTLVKLDNVPYISV